LADERHREAIAGFKQILKQEPRPSWRSALADAYAGRVCELAAKDMLKEALAIWENRAGLDEDIPFDPEHAALLLRMGRVESVLGLAAAGGPTGPGARDFLPGSDRRCRQNERSFRLCPARLAAGTHCTLGRTRPATRGPAAGNPVAFHEPAPQGPGQGLGPPPGLRLLLASYPANRKRLVALGTGPPTKGEILLLAAWDAERRKDLWDEQEYWKQYARQLIREGSGNTPKSEHTLHIALALRRCDRKVDVLGDGDPPSADPEALDTLVAGQLEESLRTRTIATPICA